MIVQRGNIFSSWPLYLSVALLVANDHVLKYTYPGFVTGKLSDVAGIFLAVLLLRSLFPDKARTITAGLIIGFVFWKSHCSQPLIDALNQSLPLTISRTVDYTDLAAFAVIPAAHHVFDHIQDFQLRLGLFRILKVPVAVMTVLAIMGTSVIRPYGSYAIRKEAAEQQIERERAIALIRDVADDYRLECVDCDPADNDGVFGGNATTIRYAFLDNNRGVVFEVTGPQRGLIFEGDGPEIVEGIQWRLQESFGREFKGMELVIKLPARRGVGLSGS